MIVGRNKRRLDFILGDVRRFAFMTFVLAVAAVDGFTLFVRGMPDLRTVQTIAVRALYFV